VRFRATCQNCNGIVEALYRPTGARACARCCKTHNGGRYDQRFRLTWMNVAE
jgi:hypothetical protein